MKKLLALACLVLSLAACGGHTASKPTVHTPSISSSRESVGRPPLERIDTYPDHITTPEWFATKELDYTVTPSNVMPGSWILSADPEYTGCDWGMKDAKDKLLGRGELEPGQRRDLVLNEGTSLYLTGRCYAEWSHG
jgi:hypothetical protein